MTTIARKYGSQDAATAAMTALQNDGFKADAIQVVSRNEPPPASSPGADAPSDPVLDQITKAGVPHARFYAEAVRQGEALVIVQPPFGHAQAAVEILQGLDPIPVAIPATEQPSVASRDNPAPLSAALGIPVLSSNPTPLSRRLNWRTLAPERANSKTLASIRKESRDPAPLSRTLGIPVLSDNPAPLSEKLGWRLVSEKAAPLSEKIGMPVLSHNPTPLSSALGWRVLSEPRERRSVSNNPAPLSSRLGLPVLWRTDRKP